MPPKTPSPFGRLGATTFALAAAFLGSPPLRADIVINEIYYDAEPNTSCAEFIEIYNSGDDPVDLSGWRFSEGIDYTFPGGTILGAGEYLVLTESIDGFNERFGAQPPAPASGPLAHWTFDESTGTSAADAIGLLNANGVPKTAVASGGVDLNAEGVFGGSGVSLNGAAGSYLTIPYLDGIQNNSFTIAGWYKANDTGANPIIADWSNPWAFMLFGNGTSFIAWQRYSANPAGNTFALTGTNAVQTGVWKHVAVTWDRPSQVARLYIDGALAASQIAYLPAANLPMIDNNRNYHIGWKQDSTDTFNGNLDEIWVANDALPPRAIADLYTANTFTDTDALDLADIIGGGDGTGTGAPLGINAASGTIDSATGAGNQTEATAGSYYAVNNPLIDGVFVPNGTIGAQPITSTGVTHDFVGTGNAEVSWGYFFNGVGPIDDPSGGNNLPFFSSGADTSMIAAHAQKGITFDLDAIEAAHDGRQVLGFSCIVGDSRPKASGNIGYVIMVDGVVKATRMGVADAEDAVEFTLAPGDRFLTLAITNSDNTNNSDHGYFGNPFLRIEAAPEDEEPEPGDYPEAFGEYAGGLSNDGGEDIVLANAEGTEIDRVDYGVESPWPIAANGGGVSIELINAGLDNDLSGSWRSATDAPTPGGQNSAYADNAPPALRQVDHSPNQPTSAEAAAISVKVTDPDGVASVELQYQIVTPGNYVSAYLAKTTAELTANPNADLAPNPAYEQNWQSVAMLDDGNGADAAAGDDTYTAVIPAQGNRVLVRYRIVAEDALGAQVRLPYPDDPSLNFAYYVYDGVPDFVADTRSVTGSVPYTHPKEALTKLPVYSLLTTQADYDQCVVTTVRTRCPPTTTTAAAPSTGRRPSFTMARFTTTSATGCASGTRATRAAASARSGSGSTTGTSRNSTTSRATHTRPNGAA
ncbi:MAG: lamin tail domain-containing protein [Verrucomicrobiales bacterium]